VPAVWISNEVWQIDTAYRRRFDYVLEMLPPPRSVRARVLRRAFAETEVSPEWIESAAGNEQLQLGHLERAIRIGKAAGGEHAASLEPVLERVLGNLVHALNEKPPRWNRHAARTPYRLDTVNADFDLQRLAQGLQQSRRGTLCLYGPPGTGKTAFGDYLAARLDLPVIRRRASDLISAWLGETEAKIARMFREAERSGAMVLLDEADSFLRSRETAAHSWEVTQVNELLVQMESFTGLFIATTNHFGSTDPASLRRFDFKIRFDYPTPEQSWELFQCVIERQRVVYDVDESLLRERLAKLGNLAPGDFATVIRQSAILGEALTATTFLGRLAKECAIKPDAPRPGIGFTVQ
jgi:SpoVK/Ycf46/Vps4 family AAA+-type ATPase